MSKMSKLREYGLLFAIISPICSSIATIFLSGATKFLSPLIAASIGGIVGGLLLFVILAFTKEKNIFRKAVKNAKDIAAMTLLRPLLGTLFFTVGLSMTLSIKAIFFTKIEPYFVLISDWIFLREKIKPRHIILLAVHIAGVVILSTGGDISGLGKTQIGDVLIIIAMALFALSYPLGAKLSKSMGAKAVNAITMLAAGLILLPAVLFISTSNVWLSQTGWMYFIGYVVLFNVIGLTLWYASLKTVRGWIVSALRAIGPLVGVPFAFFLFGETLSPIQIFGALVVLVTSITIAREHGKKK